MAESLLVYVGIGNSYILTWDISKNNNERYSRNLRVKKMIRRPQCSRSTLTDQRHNLCNLIFLILYGMVSKK